MSRRSVLQAVPDTILPAGDQAAVAPAAPFAPALQAFEVVAQALHEERPPAEVLRVSAAQMAALLRVSRCLVFVPDDVGTFRGNAAVGADEPHVQRLVSGLEADRLTRAVLETADVVAIDDARRDERTVRSAMRTWDVHSVLGVPVVDRGDVIAIFFADEPGHRHPFGCAERQLARTFAGLVSVAYVQSRTAEAARRAVAAARAESVVLRRAMGIDERLWAAALMGADDHGLAQVIADATGWPCAVHGRGLQRLATATPGQAEGAPLPCDLADPRVHGAPELAEAVVPGERPAASIVAPVLGGGLPHRMLIARAGQGEGERFLVFSEYGRRFHAVDRSIGRRAVAVLAARAQMVRQAVEADDELRAAALAELLAGEADPARHARAASVLAVADDARSIVCTVARPGKALDQSAAQAAFAAVLGPERVLACTVGGGTSVLLTADAAADLRADVTAACRRLTDEGPVVAALSGEITGCRGLAAGQEEAAEALACATALGGTRRDVVVVDADDLGPGRTLLAAAGAAGAERFVTRTLGGLLDPAAASLLATLEHLSRHAWNVRAAAEELDVHENTIRYRLGRIEELSGLCVRGDARAQMEARLALLILGLMGRLPAEADAGAVSLQAGGA
ncbi:MAG TPA: helix-turn-helix domain-containing protein [Baekduia sp.]|nr:helix-turn-helix domain-containing protein [Baekduia sp.]